MSARIQDILEGVLTISRRRQEQRAKRPRSRIIQYNDFDQSPGLLIIDDAESREICFRKEAAAEAYAKDRAGNLWIA